MYSILLLLNASVQHDSFGFCLNYIDCYKYAIVQFFFFLPSLNYLEIIKKMLTHQTEDSFAFTKLK